MDFVEELEEAAALLAARGDRRPHPLVVALARLATRPLRDPTVDHAVPNLLLRVVLRRLHRFREQEPKTILRQIVLATLLPKSSNGCLGELWVPRRGMNDSEASSSKYSTAAKRAARFPASFVAGGWRTTSRNRSR